MEMPEIPRDEAIKLYRSGQSMAALARRYGVSSGWLAGQFREWNEPVRGHAAAQRARKGVPLATYRRGAGLPP